jgi:hypothetical protein
MAANRSFSHRGRGVVREVPIDVVTGIAEEDQLTFEGDNLTLQGIPLKHSVE